MNVTESQSSSDTVMMMDIDPPPHHHHTPANSQLSPTLTTPASTLRTPLTSSTRREDDSKMTVEPEGTSSRGAGPSTLPFYTLAPVRSGPPQLRMRLHASQDLITRLGLLPAFDDLVRPFIRNPDGGPVDAADEKGKGKEVVMMQGVEGQTSPTANVGAKPEGAEENKKEHKNGWRSLVQPQVSGKFSTKKDTYLGDLVSYQQRPPMKIRPFDLGTLNGFRLEEGQLDAPTLQQLGLGPDEKKKKKKKKKLLPDGSAAPGDATAGAAPGPSQTGASLNGTPRSSNHPAASPRPPAIHPAYLKNNNSPYPQSNRPPLPQTPSQPPANFNGGNSNGGAGGGAGGHYWLGQPVPPEVSGAPKPPGATSVMVNGKAARVRKERDEGTSTAGGAGGAGSAGQGQGQPRPHKKRKMDATSPTGSSQHHGIAAHHQQKQPMQQATPTF